MYHYVTVLFHLSHSWWTVPFVFRTVCITAPFLSPPPDPLYLTRHCNIPFIPSDPLYRTVCLPYRVCHRTIPFTPFWSAVSYCLSIPYRLYHCTIPFTLFWSSVPYCLSKVPSILLYHPFHALLILCTVLSAYRTVCVIVPSLSLPSDPVYRTVWLYRTVCFMLRLISH